MPSIGPGIGVNKGGGSNWAKYWAANQSLTYSSRSGLSLLETGSGSSLNAEILPSVGKINATNYLTQSYTNFEVADSSGYVEISFYHNGQTGIRDLFATGSNAATQRYFRIYISTNNLYFGIRSNISTVFNNLLFLTGGLTTGWHTIKFSSNGSAYSLLLNGNAAGLTVSTGLNDGRWLNMVPTRNTLQIGAYTDSSGTAVSATDHYIRYVDYNNKHFWNTHGQGNRVFDLIGTDHWTWTGTAHQSFNSSGSQLLLDNGFSIWRKIGSADEYVPYKGGSPFDVSSVLTDYIKISDHAGSASSFNLAPALVGFNPTSSANALLQIFDRQNATRQTATSRSSIYYDATSLATRSRYHSSEISNPVIYHTFFNNGYRGLLYPAVTTAISSTNYYPTSLTAFYTLGLDTKGSTQYKSMQFCGTFVFSSPGYYDGDGYALALLTDIKQFGASTTASPEDNFAAIQRAVNYTYNNTLTFGLAGETYNVSQPVYIRSFKTLTIDSTIKIKNATIVNLTQNYVAGEDHIHVTDSSAFNVGEWVGMRDSNSTYDYNLWWGWNTWIVGIDRNNHILYFNSAESAASIWNYSVAQGAWVGHAQSVFIGENKTNITLNGTGIVDCNQANQAPINGLLAGSVFEELRSTSGFAGWVTDNITIQNLSFINGLRHNICISGTSQVAATRCDNIDILNVTSTFAHNKNCNIRYCDDVLVEDYTGNDALYEDGLMFYLGNTNVIVNRATCRRNGRHGISWNSAVGTGLTLNTATTSGNFYAGISITAAGANLSNLTMSDRLLVSNQYNNADNITMNGVAISNFTPIEGLYSDSIVALLGEINNVQMTNLTITDCNGLGILSTNQFTPANPPVNVDFINGGFYNHTGTKSSIYAGSDIVFTNFANYP